MNKIRNQEGKCELKASHDMVSHFVSSLTSDFEFSQKEIVFLSEWFRSIFERKCEKNRVFRNILKIM